MRRGNPTQVRILWPAPFMGLQLNWESTCLADKRLRVRSSSIPPLYPDIGQLELLRMIRDHEIAGLNPAIRTILEPVLISFALGAAVCWFESSLPEHYREVGKLVKPAIISVRSLCSLSLAGRAPYLAKLFYCFFIILVIIQLYNIIGIKQRFYYGQINQRIWKTYGYCRR